MHLTERFATVRKVLFILGQLSDGDVDWLAANGDKRNAAAGTVLIEAGRRLDTMFIVLDGELAVSTAQGKHLATLYSGEIVGEMSLVDANPTSAAVKASAPTELLAISHARIRAKLAEDVGFASRFYKALTIFLVDRMRNTISQLAYGDGAPAPADRMDPDELDLEVLDNVHLAGARFERLLKNTRS